MAKEVIFDSERFEKKQTIKRYAIPAAALLGVVVLAVVVALILRGRGGKPVVGGEDTAYPYTWAVNKNGSILLEIDRSASPGYAWSAPDADPLLDIDTRQDDQNGKSVFTLTPRTAGRTVLVFSLLPGEEAQGSIYEINALVEIIGDGKKLSGDIIGINGTPRLGVVRGGEDTACPYLVSAAEDDVVVIMKNPPHAETADRTEAAGDPEDKEDRDWYCVSDNDAVIMVMGLIDGEEETAAYLRPGTNPGTAAVRLGYRPTGTELTLEFKVDDDGFLSLLTHSLQVGSASTEAAG